MANESVERYEFGSDRAGPHLVIFGGIHGNEPCGPVALRKLVAEFSEGTRKILRGRCTVFPVCNPRAFGNQSRYVDENLNRVFGLSTSPLSYERRLAAQIAPFLAEADALLDIHSMQSTGDPFVFLNAPTRESSKLCEALGVTTILRGWPDVYAAHPELLASCTQTFADLHGLPNALIECGRHQDPAAAAVAYRAAIGALGHYGLIEKEVAETPFRFSHLKMERLFLRLHPDDRFPKEWKNFEAYREGELLGTRATGEKIHAGNDGVMVLPSPVSAQGTEWFYTGRPI